MPIYLQEDIPKHEIDRIRLLVEVSKQRFRRNLPHFCIFRRMGVQVGLFFFSKAFVERFADLFDINAFYIICSHQIS